MSPAPPPIARVLGRLGVPSGDSTNRGAAGVLVLKVADAGATFALNVILARLLGPAGLGVYALAMSWAAIATVPALVGQESLTVRFVATYRAEASWALLRGYLRFTVRLVGLVSIALATFGLVVLGLSTADDPTRFAAFAGAMAIVPVMAVLRVTQAALRGLRRVVIGYVPEMLVLPVGLFALLSLAALAEPILSPATAVTVQLAASIAALVAAAILLSRSLPPEGRGGPSESRSRLWLRGAVPLLVIGFAQVANRNADIVLVGALAGDEAAGVYAVAARSAGVVGFMLFAVNAAYAPVIAIAHAAGDRARLQTIATRTARMALLTSLPASCFFIIFGGRFVELFGPGFAGSVLPLAILSVGQLVNASLGSVALFLTMTGHERFAARGFVIGAILSVALNAALIPLLGVIGAATATTISVTAWNVMLAVDVHRLLGLHSTALGVIRRPGA